MKTAIITGASSGLGAEFARKAKAAFPELECLWLIARRTSRLEALASELEGVKLRLLSIDLCDTASFDELGSLLAEERPDVRLLVNNAGCGYLGNIGETAVDMQTRMIDLNLRALTAITALTVPYMSRGSKIVNLSSIASFCPNPRMTVYSSTKAYVSSFSRGLGEELRSKGITVTAVCPGPMRTEFLDVGRISGNSKMFEALPYCDPVRVVDGAYAAAAAGRAVYTPRAFFKFYRVLAKILPQALVVKLAKT